MLNIWEAGDRKFSLICSCAKKRRIADSVPNKVIPPRGLTVAPRSHRWGLLWLHLPARSWVMGSEVTHHTWAAWIQLFGHGQNESRRLVFKVVGGANDVSRPGWRKFRGHSGPRLVRDRRLKSIVKGGDQKQVFDSKNNPQTVSTLRPSLSFLFLIFSHFP